MKTFTLKPAVGSWMSNQASAAFSLPSWTINITKEDSEIVEGTFSFIGYNGQDKTTKKITEGKFKVKIQ